ncbi:hypothetical protein K438DRAFT_1931964 [Mycena galopus ATCC 62051]|nr:hypothetical protein K438DRAFT_1931964 [Mycena galopus ATCC 62051]
MSRDKLLKDAVVAAVDTEIQRSCPQSTFPAVSPTFWLRFESSTVLQIEEMFRTGRHSLAVLYFCYNKDRGITQRTYEIVQQSIFTQRTYRELFNHADFLGSPQSTAISTQIFLLWVAGLSESLEPARLTDWFRGVFGPLIGSAEQVIMDTDSDDSDSETEQPPNKKLRLDSDGKYATAREILRQLRSLEPQAASTRPSRRSPSSTSTSNGGAKPGEPIGRVRQAAASITQKSPPPSCPAFAPVLDPKPAAMPGAWPPTPPRPFKRTRSSTFSRFSSTTSHHRPPTHFCPVIETALSKSPRQGSPLNTI